MKEKKLVIIFVIVIGVLNFLNLFFGSVKISTKPLKRYVRTITGVKLWSVDG